MKKLIFILCHTFLVATMSHAQDEDLQKLLPTLGKYVPENVYLHWDKTFCMAGDTMWFKAYILQGSQLSNNSTTLLVDMFDKRGYLMAMKSFPISSGVAIGQLELPDNCSPGVYYIRAYTKWQLNFGYESLYQVPVTVVDTKSDRVAALTNIRRNSIANMQHNDSISLVTSYNERGLSVSVSSSTAEVLNKPLDMYFISPKISGKASIVLTKDSTRSLLFPVTQEQAGHEVDVVMVDENNNVLIQKKAHLPSGQLAVDLVMDTLSNAEKGLNSWKINIKDSSIATLSVSVTDAELDTARVTINNSISSSRIDYQSLLNNKLPALDFVDSNYIRLKGKAERVIRKKKLKEKNLLAFITAKDSSRSFQFIPIDTAGRFDLRNLFFYDTCTVLFQLEDKESRAKDVALQFDRFFRPLFIPDTNQYEFRTRTALQQTPLMHVSRRKESLFDYNKVGAMKEVVVTAKKKSVAEKMDEEYATGAFRGGINSRGFDVINDRFAIGTPNVLEYIRNRMPSIEITMDGGKVAGATYRRDKLLFFLNEVQCDVDQIINMPMSQIAYIKMHPAPFVGGFLMQGAVCVYTKTGNALEEPEPRPLDEVLVVAKRSYKKLDNAYTTGRFTAKADYSIDLREAKDEHDMYKFLEKAIPGFEVRDQMGATSVLFRNKPVVFFMDEWEVPQWQIDLYRFQVNFLAYAKLFGTFLHNGEVKQAIALYTRQGEDVGGGFDGLNKAKLAGYNRIFMPYQPDYADSAKADYADNRTRLFWNPLVSAGESAIRFYNNDYTKKFRITIEGVGMDGRLFHYEKIVH